MLHIFGHSHIIQFCFLWDRGELAQCTKIELPFLMEWNCANHPVVGTFEHNIMKFLMMYEVMT